MKCRFQLVKQHRENQATKIDFCHDFLNSPRSGMNYYKTCFLYRFEFTFDFFDGKMFDGEIWKWAVYLLFLFLLLVTSEIKEAGGEDRMRSLFANCL